MVIAANIFGRSIAQLCLQGAMTFGKEGAEGARVHSIDTVNEILDIFQKHGHDEARLFTFDSDLRWLNAYTGRYSSNLLRRDL